MYSLCRISVPALAMLALVTLCGMAALRTEQTDSLASPSPVTARALAAAQVLQWERAARPDLVPINPQGRAALQADAALLIPGKAADGMSGRMHPAKADAFPWIMLAVGLGVGIGGGVFLRAGNKGSGVAAQLEALLKGQAMQLATATGGDAGRLAAALQALEARLGKGASAQSALEGLPFACLQVHKDKTLAASNALAGGMDRLGKPVEPLLDGLQGAADLVERALRGEAASSLGERGGRRFLLAASPVQGAQPGAVLAWADVSLLTQETEAVSQKLTHLLAQGSGVNELAQRVASASEELSATADEQASGAQAQKTQAEAVATAMEEMNATVFEVAKNAAETADVATEASSAATRGVRLVREAVDSINVVADSASRLETVLQALDSQSGEIGRVINVINEIADQTNLLALNAAIEAARAGDAGRGFAVVADEVRKLAEKTMAATKEVEISIRKMQEDSRQAMQSMSETRHQVDSSTASSNRAGSALEEITARIQDMTSRVAQIATAAEQQRAAAEEINQNIEEISNIAGEAEEAASQTASATRDLAALALELLTLSQTLSGAQEDPSRLRHSKGEMRGVLPKMMQEWLRKQFPPQVVEAVREETGNVTFLPTASYPDQVMHQMVEAAARKAGKKPRDIFLQFGKFTAVEFHRIYKRYFKTTDLKEFYLTMNDTHAQLTKDMPGIKPPRFTYEDKGDTLVMTYHSPRGYQDYFEGILRGAAEFFKRRVDIRMERLDASTGRAVIRFL
ncbi:methyl-accepting chemotaxis protein [Megalodesulfovibrio paquesii]